MTCVIFSAILMIVYILFSNSIQKRNEEMYMGAVSYIEENPFAEEMYGAAYWLSLPEEKGRHEEVKFVDTDIYQLPLVVDIPDAERSYLVWVQCQRSEDGNSYSYASIIELDVEQ